MPETLRLISPEERIANVRRCLLIFAGRLRDNWRLSLADARRLVRSADRLGRTRRLRQLDRLADCWAAVAALDQLRSMRRAYDRGDLGAIPDDGLPF